MIATIEPYHFELHYSALTKIAHTGRSSSDFPNHLEQTSGGPPSRRGLSMSLSDLQYAYRRKRGLRTLSIRLCAPLCLRAHRLRLRAYRRARPRLVRLRHVLFLLLRFLMGPGVATYVRNITGRRTTRSTRASARTIQISTLNEAIRRSPRRPRRSSTRTYATRSPRPDRRAAPRSTSPRCAP